MQNARWCYLALQYFSHMVGAISKGVFNRGLSISVPFSLIRVQWSRNRSDPKPWWDQWMQKMLDVSLFRIIATLMHSICFPQRRGGRKPRGVIGSNSGVQWWNWRLSGDAWSLHGQLRSFRHLLDKAPGKVNYWLIAVTCRSVRSKVEERTSRGATGLRKGSSALQKGEEKPAGKRRTSSSTRKEGKMELSRVSRGYKEVRG